METEKKLNNSSNNIFKRNNLDIDNDIDNTENKDNHSIISQKWALKVNLGNQSENEEKEPKINKSQEQIEASQEQKGQNLEINNKNEINIIAQEALEVKDINQDNKNLEQKKEIVNNDKNCINDENENKKSDEELIEDKKNDEIKEEKEINEIDDLIENEDKKEKNRNKLKTGEKEEKEGLLDNIKEDNKSYKNKKMVASSTSDRLLEEQKEKEFQKEFKREKEKAKGDKSLEKKIEEKFVDKEDEIIETKNKNIIVNINNENISNKDENNSNKKHKLKIQEINIEENKKDSTDNNLIEKSSHKKIQKRRNKRTFSTKIFEQKFNLDKIGKIKIAKNHAEANRILKQIRSFNNDTEFCPCCCLPCPQEGVLEHFSYCDDTDKFVELGQGTSLYFSFFKYSMIIISMTALIIGIPFLIFSYQYTYSIQKICNYYYNLDGSTKDCELYITVKDYASDIYSYVDSPFFLFSTANIKDYRNNYYTKHNGTDKNNFEKAILNYPLLNLICSITLFIINILYTILIYNKNVSYDYQITSPSDYTVLITNMDEVLSHYLNIRKKYEEMIKNEPNKLNEDGTPFDFQKELNQELNIPNSNFEKKRSTINKNRSHLISRLKEFSDFIENNICINQNKEKYNIKQLNICFKLNEFMQLEEELHTINTQIVKINNHPYQIERNKIYDEIGEERRYFGSILSGYNLYWFNCCDQGIKISELENLKKEKEAKISKLMRKSIDIDENNFAGVAFVSFNTIKEQEDFLSQFPTNIFSYFLKIITDLKYIFFFCCLKKDLKANLSVSTTSEPEDILYENLEYSSIKRTFRTLIVYIISILLIGACFGIFIGLNILQEKVNEQAIHIILSYILSLCNTCVSSCLNIIFQMILDFLTKQEKPYTMTEYYRSYSVKLTLFSFFTSSVVPLICELIRNSNGYEILISNMLMMFLVNAFVTPIMWTFNFTYFLKKFQICLIDFRKDPKNEDKNHNMTQRELNDLYELPDMCIAYKYSYLAKTILMTFLYIPIFPLGIAISLVGFVLGYLLEKFNYAHMYKRPEMLNHRLCAFYVNHFDVVFFVYAIGDYIFMNDSYENRNIPLAKIIIFGIITAIPYSKFLKKKCIGIHESDINSNEYKDKYFTFSTDYERANPMTRKKGIKQYLQNLLECKKITPKEYHKLLSQSDSLNLMELYYESRQNKNLYDAQKNFAMGGGKFFLNNIIRSINVNDNKNINIININEENIQPSHAINNIFNNEINNREEHVEKEEEKNIANIYKKPFFIGYGGTIQSYLNQIIQYSENNEDKKEKNDSILENNDEYDKDNSM